MYKIEVVIFIYIYIYGNLCTVKDIQKHNIQKKKIWPLKSAISPFSHQKYVNGDFIKQTYYFKECFYNIRPFIDKMKN